VGATARPQVDRRGHRSASVRGLSSQMLPGTGGNGQADPGPVQPHSICGHRAPENRRAFGGGELFPGGEPEDLLVAGLQAGKGERDGAGQFADIVCLVLQLGPGSALPQRFPQADRFDLTAPQVRDFVQGHPVEPWKGHSRDVVQAAPRHQECLGHDLLGQVGTHTTLDEVTHTPVVFAVEGGEALRVIASLTPDRHRGNPVRDRLFGTVITLITSVQPN